MAADEMRQGPSVPVELTMHEVHRYGHELGPDHQHPVLERNVDRQRGRGRPMSLPNSGTILAVRRLIDEPGVGATYRSHLSPISSPKTRQQPGRRNATTAEPSPNDSVSAPGNNQRLREAWIKRSRSRSRRCDANHDASVRSPPEKQGRYHEDGYEEDSFRSRTIQKH